MPVEEDGWLAGSFQRFRVDERVETRRDDLSLLMVAATSIWRRLSEFLRIRASALIASTNRISSAVRTGCGQSPRRRIQKN